MRLARPLWSIGLALTLAVHVPLYAASTSSGSVAKPALVAPRLAPPSISRSPATSGSISKPPIATSSPSGSISKPPLTAQAPITPSPRTTVDTTIAKGQSQQAYRQFKSDQERFRAPPVPADTKTAQQSSAWRNYGSRWNSADAYYAARTDALRRSPTVRMYYEHPPVYVLAGRPSYGAYAAAFLGGVLLDRITQQSYAHWAYSHANDPGFQAWYADMQRQAADNEELRAKLAQLDQQIAALKVQNAPVTESLPDDVDPSLVVAPQTVMLATDTSSHWWMYSAIILAIIVVFFASCIFISQRKIK